MSLINDMLRNIDDKRPDDLARQNLQREIRALPAGPDRGKQALKFAVVLGVLVLAVGAAAMHAAGKLLPSLGLDIHIPPPEPIAAPAPMPQAIPAVPAPIATVDSENRPIYESMQLASELALVPLPAAPVVAVPDPVQPSPAAKTEKNVALPVAADDTPKPTPLSGPVRIEKSPVLATPRDRAEAEYRKAETALAGGRSSEALDALRSAVKIDATYVPARQALLRQLLDARKMDEAMAVLQDGLADQPVQTGWAMSLARLQLEQGDLAAADRTLARSQSYAEANADYAGFQGHLKSRLGAQQQAINHYRRATRLVPGEGRWWLGLGLALEAHGQSAEAKEAFRRSRATGTLSADLAAIAEQHLHN